MKKMSLLLAVTMLSGVFSTGITAGAEMSAVPKCSYTNEFSYDVYGGDNSENLTNTAIFRDPTTLGCSPADQGIKELVSGVGGKASDDYSLAISNTSKKPAYYYVGPTYDVVDTTTVTPDILYFSAQMANYDMTEAKDIFFRVRQYDTSNATKTVNKKVVTMGKDGKITSDFDNAVKYDYSLEKMYRFDFVFNRVSGTYSIYVDGHSIAAGTASDIVPSAAYPKYELNANNQGTTFGFQLGAYNNSATETIRYAIDDLKYQIYDTDVYSELCSQVVSEAYKDWDDENEPVAAYSYTNGFDYSVYGGDKLTEAKSLTHAATVSSVGYTTTADTKLISNVGTNSDDDFSMSLSTSARDTAAWFVSPEYDAVSMSDKTDGNKRIMYFSTEMANFDPNSEKYINLTLKPGSKLTKSIIKMGVDNLIKSDFDSTLAVPYRSYVMYKFDFVFDRINGDFAIYMDGTKIASGVAADIAPSETVNTIEIQNNKSSQTYGLSVGFWNATAGITSKIVIDNIKYEMYKASSFKKICGLVEGLNTNITKQPIENDFSSSVTDSTAWKNSFFRFLNFSDGNSNGSNGNQITHAAVAANIGGRNSDDSSLYITSDAGTYSNTYTNNREPKIFYNIDAYDNDRSKFTEDWKYSDNSCIKAGISFMLPEDENVAPYNKMFIALRSKEYGDKNTIEFNFNEAKIGGSMNIGEFKKGKWYRYEIILTNGGTDENVTYADYYLDGTKLNAEASVISGKISQMIDMKIAFDSDYTVADDNLTFTIAKKSGIYLDDLYIGAPESEYSAFKLPEFADDVKHQDIIGYYTADDNKTVEETIASIANISDYSSRQAMNENYEGIDEASQLPVIGKYIRLVEDGQEIYITFAKRLSLNNAEISDKNVTVSATGMDTSAKVIVAGYNDEGLVGTQIKDYNINANYTAEFESTISKVKVFAWNIDNLKPVCANLDI